MAKGRCSIRSQQTRLNRNLAIGWMRQAIGRLRSLVCIASVCSPANRRQRVRQQTTTAISWMFRPNTSGALIKPNRLVDRRGATWGKKVPNSKPTLHGSTPPRRNAMRRWFSVRPDGVVGSGSSQNRRRTNRTDKLNNDTDPTELASVVLGFGTTPVLQVRSLAVQRPVSTEASSVGFVSRLRTLTWPDRRFGRSKLQDSTMRITE